MPPVSAAGPLFPWLVTDLDGTLVGRDLRIVRRSADALRRYRERGGTVYIATGRNEESAGRYHRDLGLDTPMILYNGARVVDPATGRRLLDLRLDDSCLWNAVLPELPAGVGAVGFAGEDAYALRAVPALADYARRDGITLRADAPAEPLTKAMLIAPAPPLDGLAALVAERCPGVRLLQSEDTYLEILPADAGKGPALRWLTEREGIDLSRVAAIGDNPNDIDMMTAAGLGAAVGDGHPETRAAADIVVGGCAEGAVADLVDRILADGKPE
ncbi:haloacid dehalogenase [Actinoallomurus iriomotensis]|uniref:Haloacid dehalogenase n=1 Tax=Actinoallomurus iriomotensis TaxID=478107 RepID=A0A9W6RXH2_9ACTN|nr:haloacid dehalogenase [Actinoallomurus iriomotensis]